MDPNNGKPKFDILFALVAAGVLTYYLASMGKPSKEVVYQVSPFLKI